MFGQLLENANQIDSDYAKALAAVAVWRTNVLPARTRCGALFFRASNLGGIMQPSTYHCPLFHIRTASLGRWVARRMCDDAKTNGCLYTAHSISTNRTLLACEPTFR
jgi:hypothetical protein